MKDIDSNTRNAIINDLVENVLTIVVRNDSVPYLTITEKNIVSESMVLKQSVCDQSDLKFGGCISSEFNIDLINTEDRMFSNDLVGKRINVILSQTYRSSESLYPKNKIYPSVNLCSGNKNDTKKWYLFNGYIDSAERDQSNKNVRHIIAYDAFSVLYRLDATDIVYSKLKSNATFGSILKSCSPGVVSEHINAILETVIAEATGLTLNDSPLFNEDWINNNETISKGEVVRMCCEMIGGFGVISFSGNIDTFDIVFLGDNPNSYGEKSERYDFYEQFYSEEYTSYGYNYCTFAIGGNSRNEKIHTRVANINTRAEKRIYDITDNVFCWQESDGSGNPTTSNTNIINLFNSISELKMYIPKFTPLSATVEGRLWVELCDSIRIVVNQTDTEGNYVYDDQGNIDTEIIKSYVLSRTLTGIKALTDEIESKGA